MSLRYKTFNLLCFIFLFYSCQNNVNYTEKETGKLRIISLTPSITTQLVELGVEENIVGCTSYCNLPNKNDTMLVGSTIEINEEKILLLKPDIVFLLTLTKPSVIQKLINVGLNVKQFSKVESYEHICQQFTEIGELVGKGEFAKRTVKEERIKMDSLQLLIPKSQKPKMFIEIGTNPLFTAIPNTFMNDFITLSGCENIAHDFKRGSITREGVILRNPDVIIIATMGVKAEEEKAVWETYPELSANKNNKIFVMDAYKLCGPTPITFTETTAQLIELIYNEE